LKKVIVDSNYLCYRTSFGLKTSLSFAGQNTSIIYGFLKSMIEIIGAIGSVDSIIFTWDSKKVIEKRIFPGYVLVDMEVTDDSWYVVRNTPNVTGFVGAGTTPVPVSLKEIEILKKRLGSEEPQYKIDVNKGDHVKDYRWSFLRILTEKFLKLNQEKGKLKF